MSNLFINKVINTESELCRSTFSLHTSFADKAPA